jgi:hypothetical protein
VKLTDKEQETHVAIQDVSIPSKIESVHTLTAEATEMGEYSFDKLVIKIGQLSLTRTLQEHEKFKVVITPSKPTLFVHVPPKGTR